VEGRRPGDSCELSAVARRMVGVENRRRRRFMRALDDEGWEIRCSYRVMKSYAISEGFRDKTYCSNEYLPITK
jgi:hypothetical protein